jgi:uncharacterized protein YrzB (UPF0473 family)
MSESEFEEHDLITVTDADGEQHEFVLFAVFEMEDQDFAVLAPRDELETEGGTLQLFFFSYELRDLEHHFTQIDDEDLYVRARDMFYALAEQSEGDDVAEA